MAAALDNAEQGSGALDPATCSAAELPALGARLAALVLAWVARVAAEAAAPPPRDPETLLAPAEVAAELHVPESTADKLIAARVFPVERHGRYVRVRLGDLLAYRATRREAARPLPAVVHRRYSPSHDKHRPSTPPPPDSPPHASATRRRPRRATDDGRPVGARRETDFAPRGNRPHALRGAGEPLDLDAP
jgi:hypothetical protein